MADRLTFIGKERVFVMHWRGDDPADSVFLSQRDVRELQFAKASIATGWQILLGELGVEPEDIAQVLLAGSFGAYLSPVSAIRIGLVPRMALPRIVSAGNVAGEGAKIAALSHRERAEAHAIVREVRYMDQRRAERAADRAHDRVDAGRDADVARVDRVDDEVGHRRERERDADADQHAGDDELDTAVRVRERERCRTRSRCSDRAEHEHRAEAEAVAQAAGERAGEEHRDRARQHEQAGLGDRDMPKP